MKRRATGLLFLVTVVFVLTLPFDGPWAEYVRATAEASMVGGLADWFAVTALFRHPLGLPIPHTAVIPERKEQFGRTLGEFVQHNFLSPATISERARSANVVERGASWLADPVNAAMVAGHVADLARWAADVVDDAEVHRTIEEVVLGRVRAVPLAPLAGRALEMMTAQGRHHELLAVTLRAVDRFLQDNHDPLRRRFGEASPWWVPDSVDDRMFERFYAGARKALHEVVDEPGHELRADFDRRVQAFIEQLETSPELLARGEQVKQELLERPEVRKWSASLWGDLKAAMREQAVAPESDLRRRLAGAVQATGVRLRDDEALRAKAEEVVESAVRYVAEHFHDEVGALVETTVSRWDAVETSRKLELLLGRDLQYIRINGTVVGGLAGLLIHTVATIAT